MLWRVQRELQLQLHLRPDRAEETLLANETETELRAKIDESQLLQTRDELQTHVTRELELELELELDERRWLCSQS